MQRTADVGFESVVVDVKNHSPYVAYQSDIAPHLSTTDIRIYQPYPAGYDLLETVVDEGHAIGVDVIAAVNVFSEGSTTYQDGPAFDRPEWQTTYLSPVREVTTADGAAREVNGVDVVRGTDQLVAYTPAEYDVCARSLRLAPLILELFGSEVRNVQMRAEQLQDQPEGW